LARGGGGRIPPPPWGIGLRATMVKVIQECGQGYKRMCLIEKSSGVLF
jgi:hypothetical protein